MRDAHRMREKYDLSLDSRQVVSLLIGGIVVLGAVFVLGVLVGKKLAGAPPREPWPGPPHRPRPQVGRAGAGTGRAAADLPGGADQADTASADGGVRPPATLRRPAPRPPRRPSSARPACPLRRPRRSPRPQRPSRPLPGLLQRRLRRRRPRPAPAASARPSSASSKPAASGRATPVTTVAAVDPKSEAARAAHTESVATRTAPAAAAHPAPKVPEADQRDRRLHPAARGQPQPGRRRAPGEPLAREGLRAVHRDRGGSGQGDLVPGTDGKLPHEGRCHPLPAGLQARDAGRAFVASTGERARDDHDTTGGEALGLRADLGAHRPLRRQAAAHHPGPQALAPVPQQEGRDDPRPERDGCSSWSTRAAGSSSGR